MTPSTKRDRLFVLLVVAMATLFLFAKPIFDGEQFLFRDAAHFYHPSLKFAQAQWGKTLPSLQVPLWNSAEELGRPLLADPTSALLYPGKLVFALSCSFDTSYSCYIIGHVLFAAFSAYVASRMFGVNVLASGLAGVSYAFGGAILFQYSNVIFLIGASWLPIGLALGWTSISRKDWRYGVACATVQAMMVLGGDPQMAYYLALLTFVGAITIWIRHFDSNSSRSHKALLIAVACPALAVLLAAAQVFPSLEWTGQSSRHTAPMLMGADHQSPFVQPVVGSHQSKRYNFSIPPWRWAELLLPKFSGELFPENHRWIGVLPANDRTWAPSLYMGLLPLLLAIQRMRAPRDSLDRWLRAIVLIGFFGSLGWYGVGWLFNEVSAAFGGSARLWNPIGGFYWWLNSLLPVHGQFRYPAKMWTLAACGTSLMAARQAADQGPIQITLQQAMRGTILVGALCSVCCLFVVFQGHLDGRINSRLFGPLVAGGVWRDICYSFAHVAIVGSAVALVALSSLRAQSKLMVFLIALTAELCAAHHRSVVTADRSDWNSQTPLISAIKAHAKAHGHEDIRVHRAIPRSVYPSEWRNTSSPNRLRDGLLWDITTSAHRFGLAHGISVLRPAASFSSLQFERTINDTERVSETALKRACVRYVIGRDDDLQHYPDYKIIETCELFGEPIKAAYCPVACPRAHIEGHPVNSSKPGDEVRIVCDSVNHITILVALDQPGTIVLRDSMCHGWRCSVENRQTKKTTSQPIRTVEQNYRGVDLPAGTHTLRFSYEPLSFRLGATVSALSWTVLLAWTAANIWQRPSRQ